MSDIYGVGDIRIILSRFFKWNIFNIEICFSKIGLRRVPVEKVLLILEEVVGEQKPKTLKINFLNMLQNGDADLVKIAKTLKECPNIKDVLTGIAIPSGIKLTTLEPLSEVGILKKLECITAYECGLSGKNVLPSELCANLPALKELNLSSEQDNPDIIILTPETLRALPSECELFIWSKDIQVEYFSSEKDEVVLKTLPPTSTVLRWETNDYTLVSPKVGKICAEFGIERQTLIKPART